MRFVGPGRFESLGRRGWTSGEAGAEEGKTMIVWVLSWNRVIVAWAEAVTTTTAGPPGVVEVEDGEGATAGGSNHSVTVALAVFVTQAVRAELEDEDDKEEEEVDDEEDEDDEGWIHSVTVSWEVWVTQAVCLALEEVDVVESATLGVLFVPGQRTTMVLETTTVVMLRVEDDVDKVTEDSVVPDETH